CLGLAGLIGSIVFLVILLRRPPAASLPAPARPRPASLPPPTVQAYLVDSTGARIALRPGDNPVGRNPDNAIVLAYDTQVSRHHALITWDGRRLTVTDLGSSNGTFVNGQRVTGPTLVPSGAVVEFGSEGGPRVLVTYVASAAPAAAAAAPAAKPGGKGKGCLIGCLLLLVVGLCVGGGYAVSRLVGGDEPAGEGEEVSTTDEAPPPVVEDAPPPPDAAPTAPARKKIAWARLKVGSSFEMKSSTEMKMGDQTFSSESTMRQTLVALDDEHATIKTEVSVPNVPPIDPTEQKLAIYPEDGPAGEEPKKLEEKKATVTVPAGTFDCTYRKISMTVNGQEMVTETWSDDDQPLPYKMVSVGPQSTTVTELTRIDKK
ncbi:MAG: FHA domain-containing protein, partial [Planctomycetota bacterium]|nr:FHA domain-containing protein [Planctomycetota bacterium]